MTTETATPGDGVELTAAAKKLYGAYTDNHPTMHCNRFPPWEELGANAQSEWLDKARLTSRPQPATAGDVALPQRYTMPGDYVEGRWCRHDDARAAAAVAECRRVDDATVERLAKHMCREAWKDRCRTPEDLNEQLKFWRRYEDEARAALTAALNPEADGNG